MGSFLNVVIWRLPHRGREVEFLGKKGRMTLSWPPSHCPMCDRPIHWYQNIPMLSYIFLRGRCANCRADIPIRYPLVELATSLLWGGLFLAYFVAQWQATPFGWQQGLGAGVSDLAADWPVYVLHALFASALLAASAIDADLFIIPLAITWFLAILGLAGSTAIGPPLTHAYALIPGISVKFWWLAKPVAGAFVGLVVANILLWVGVLPRAFPWELEKPEESEAKDEGRKTKDKSGMAKDEKDLETMPPPPKLTRFWPSVAAALAIVVGVAALWLESSQNAAAIAGVAGAIVIFLLGVLPRDAGQVDVTDEVMEEISGPGVRLEILKEALFVAIPVVLAAAAYVIPGDLPQVPWLMRLLGSILGLLVGGGTVWVLRIGGSLAFNKQAMGIGDAHLMAGVGAIIGAPLVVVAFFAAPFVGLLWAMVLKILGKPNVLPYGPWLSVASIMVLLIGNPLIDWYVGMFLAVGPVVPGGPLGPGIH